MKTLIKKIGKRNFIIICCCLIILVVGISIFLIIKNKNKPTEIEPNNEPAEKVEEEEEKPKLKILDVDSKSRPFAVMINNAPAARPYQSGLQDAYIIYEFIVEGGLTRYMALFKDKDTQRIASVRSARHYFLDYALENDAYYIHWGWSPQAQKDISSLGINNVNGLTYEGTYFLRDRTLPVSSEHTGYTTMELLNKAVSKLNYRNTTNRELLLNYSIENIDLSTQEGATKADNVTIKYSNSVVDKYTYDSSNGYYLRYVNGKENTDYVSKEQYHFKNIITYQVSNSTISSDTKGRQTINNTGSGEGYYITNGYAIKIKWSKQSRNAQTKYTYLNGEEINVNDGNTFIQVQPTGQYLNIE